MSNTPAEPFLRGFPPETHRVRRLQVALNDFAQSFQSLMAAFESGQKVNEVQGGRTPILELRCLQDSSMLIKELINGGVLKDLDGVSDEAVMPWGVRLENLIRHARRLAPITGAKQVNSSDPLPNISDCRQTLRQLLVMGDQLESSLRAMVGSYCDTNLEYTLSVTPTGEVDFAAKQIEAITGIAYPPQSLVNWGRLLELAGFDQREIRQVLTELGIPGFEGEEELPRGYVSAKASASVNNQPRQDGRVILGDSYLLTQAILAGLESRRETPNRKGTGETAWIQRTMGLWKAGAADQVEDIRSWRSTTDEIVSRSELDLPPLDMNTPVYQRLVSGIGWGMPDDFESQTTYIVGRMMAHYTNLDPGPVQEIFAAVVTWQKERNARNLPDQPTLEATLHKAMVALTRFLHFSGRFRWRSKEVSPVSFL